MEKLEDQAQLRQMITEQKQDTLSLADTINALLEISKVESGNSATLSTHRIDELLFDVIAKTSTLDPLFNFQVDFSKRIQKEEDLIIKCNPKLIKIALTNLLLNCIKYSADKNATINFTRTGRYIQLNFENSGPSITEEENKYLFNYFFRGQNSLSQRGFGLGLVLIHKIVKLHDGLIEYKTPNPNTNIFQISLPLSWFLSALRWF